MNAAATKPIPAGEADDKETTRLTLQTPNNIHRAVKSAVAQQGTTMLAVSLEMYRARYMGGEWPQDVVDQVLAQVVRAVDAGGQWPADVVASVRAQIDAEGGEPPASKRK